MKIFTLILEAILSPFSLLLRVSGNGKNALASLAKPAILLLIAILITVILILYFYRDFIF